MIIFPAIDIKNKQCVRLTQGDFGQKTAYTIKPLEAALSYQKQGATWLHIIDLDGAESGVNKNQEVIQEIIKNTNLKIQLGGGIRSKEKIEELLELGVNRVIVGTYAIDMFDELKELVSTYQNRIIVSLDSKDGYVTKNGWQTTTDIKTTDFINTLASIGVDTVVVTDIAKDGMMIGPNFEQLIYLNNNTCINIIASGGVSSISDVKELQSNNLYGAIIGKALYIKALDLKEAIRCSQDESFPV